MSKPVKYGIIGFFVLVLIVVIYYAMKGGTASLGTWTANPGKDVIGNDMESKPSGTLDQDKAYANSIGAKAFFRVSQGITYFKSATGPLGGASQGDVVYIKS